ncbi:MAG: FHA domain-containing protein [Elusimicrobia bacterium]|nr:FHA domain-containing protein [Elusimicrobiota bacterium]
MPKLLLKFNAAVIKEYAMDKPSFTIGRKPDNDVVIDNPAVSGHHCKISLQGDTFYVEDLESTNGTYVNEKRIMKAGLHHNDVVGLATKHVLVFMEDKPAAETAPVQKAPAAEATMMLSPEKQAEMAKAGTASAGAGQPEKVGGLRILKGVVSNPEYELKGMSTYIGKSDRVQVQIKGTGLFGSAPEVAASIHRKPEGFVLKAVQSGYPVVNGSTVADQVVLKDGDIIDCGGTTMQFYIKEGAAA